MFNEDLANKAMCFIQSLKHTKGSFHNKPFFLMDWQKNFISNVFGTVKANGYRQYNTGYLEIPKKNGKSELAAAIALYLTCGDNEWGAEVYGCAADRQQASIVFDVAKEMVKMCPALAKRCKIIESQKRIVYKPLNSFYQVLSSESNTKHGLNVHGVIFDELHAQPNRNLYDVMTNGSGDARKQPLFVILTTAGNSIHSIGYEVHQTAVDIKEERKIDNTFFPTIYGITDTDDWESEESWYRANPSLDITIDVEKVHAAYNKAKGNPAEEAIFKQLRLNQWQKQVIRWMNMTAWDNCGEKFDRERLRGRKCYGGLDLSQTQDLTAFVLVFPPLIGEDDEGDEIDKKYIILPHFWIPEECLADRVKRDHVKYDVWEKQGFMKTTKGNVVHYGFIEKEIEALGEIYNIQEIAYDRWGATQMAQNLDGMGFTVVPFGQGFKDMSPATKDMMKLALEKKLAHGGNPILRWNVENIAVKTDPAENIKPDKQKSTEKIDGAVATIMALDRATRNLSTTSVYEDRGVLVF